MEDADMKPIRKLAGVAVGAALAVAGAAAVAGPALAAQSMPVTRLATATPSTVYYDVHDVTAVGCRGELDAENLGAGKWYARGFFTDSTVSCSVWLERSTNGGRSWYEESSTHGINPGGHATTGWYWDGAGYLARVCVFPDAATGASCSASF
jgi:hypothetical protein